MLNLQFSRNKLVELKTLNTRQAVLNLIVGWLACEDR